MQQRSTSTSPDDPLLTVRQLAQREGMKPSRVWFLIQRGGLPCYDVNGIRIRWSEYREWLASKRKPTSRRG